MTTTSTKEHLAERIFVRLVVAEGDGGLHDESLDKLAKYARQAAKVFYRST